MPLQDALEWCADRGLMGVELGVGGFSRAPHADRARLVASSQSRRDLQTRLLDAGLELVAINAYGNPLHPDAAIANEHDQALREAITLAGDLGVDRVVAMSGCPGGPGERMGLMAGVRGWGMAA
ncbi:MAG: sugar phosphate isomerase/epimerase family protein [Solirubrobacteraceae bacterium]